MQGPCMIIVFAADTPVHREAAKLNAYQRLIIISVVVRPDSETSDRSHGLDLGTRSHGFDLGTRSRHYVRAAPTRSRLGEEAARC